MLQFSQFTVKFDKNLILTLIDDICRLLSFIDEIITF